MKAHIIAEGLLRIISNTGDGNYILIRSDKSGITKRPSGSYDRNILCDQCDNKLGEYDKVAIEFCRDAVLRPHPSNVAFICSDVDQKKLKLFCLSYIWRASVTDLPEFSNINLGKTYSEIIRIKLLNNNAGETNDCSVVVSKFTLDLVTAAENL